MDRVDCCDGTRRIEGAGDANVLDGPVTGDRSPAVEGAAEREDDGGGGKRGITGDAGVVGLVDGGGDVACAGDDPPLRPAKMAGIGVAIATLKGGGTGK